MAVCCWYAHNRLTGCLHCGNQTNVVKSKNPLWLVEYYTKGPDGQSGWEIQFAWIQAADKAEAVKHLEQVDKQFGEVIQIGQQSAVFDLVGTKPAFYLHDLNPVYPL